MNLIQREMKLLLGLCLLSSTACGASTEKYFCEYNIPGVPANNIAEGVDEIMHIENTPPLGELFSCNCKRSPC